LCTIKHDEDIKCRVIAEEIGKSEQREANAEREREGESHNETAA
jgi:hypothetical protein